MTDAEAWHIRQVIGDIKSLPPAEPNCSEIPNNSDCISRQAAITAIQKAYADTEGGTDKCAVWKNVGLTNALHIMQDLPSAQPDVPDTNVGDMISRQAAIDALEREQSLVEKPITETRWFDFGLRKAQDILSELPSAQPEPRWIPCSERLPEVHESGNSFSGIYMCSVPTLVYGICEGGENAQFHVATYCDDLDGTTYWSTELDAFTVTGVKAWMPLPEPYREDGEADG